MFNHFPETEMDNFWMWNINEGDLLVPYGSAGSETHAKPDALQL